MDLNNHEIVLLALSLMFLAWVISKGDLRTSLTLVLKALFAPKIIGILGAATIYIAGYTYLLSIVEIWNLDNLKTTIVWAISTAFVAMFNISKVEKEKEFFQKMIFESLALSTLITFLAELYNLSIVTEIILIPTLSLLALLSAVASTQKEAKILRVKKVIDGILLLSGIVLVSFRLYEVFSNHSKYFTISSAREFLVPVDLTIGFIPFLFILNLFVKLEMIWFSLTFKIKIRKLRFFAFYQALRSFKFELDARNRWRRFVLVSEIDNKNDVLAQSTILS